MELTLTRKPMAALILLTAVIAILPFVPLWGAPDFGNTGSDPEHGVSNLQVNAQGKILDFPDNMDQMRNRNVPIKFHLPEETAAQPMVVVSHGAGGSRDGIFALSQEMAN